MIWGAAAALAGGALVLVATAMFGIGLRQTLRATALARRHRPAPLRLVVAARRDHGNCFQLTLRRPWLSLWRPLPRFNAGMYVALQAPLGTRGNASRRYSLAGWRRLPWRYELAIKREPKGLISNWAGDTLLRGHRVSILPPAGDFVLPRGLGGEVVLVAAGIGITPLRAMVQAWAAGRRSTPMTLVWSVRQRAELMDYDTEFRALAAAQPALRYVPVLTGDDATWHGERGRVDASRLLGWCQTRDAQGVWMCASAPMMDALRAGLVAQGVDDARIHHEAFAAAANQDQQCYRLELQPSGRELTFCGEPSLLALLQAEGAPIVSDCRNGTCGSCIVQLRAGSVRQVISPEFATAPNELLACCCVPTSDLVLRCAAA
ncbi:2Fe-2S iron-sulfur cluster-binding protein [Sphaerotilus sp.]|uniref:2Fe-2S iron-sulfur cluster-binding protein n=1 Tax=Sphaerotilus sp. TaxID=2093942 RepID=UPI002ACED127|nr:2Fe-2S iron-sulfur cluster-binding protein [Sphaerotilus sp.]MDZ7855834.1 2Fe-2S iron-sulfur cluster-binding protein [Sphaerotilus sp.]